MPIELYGVPPSPPARTVALTLEKLRLDYEYKICDPLKGQHLDPEYLKINPQHNVPALRDGDFAMNESRAIICYLANAYDKSGKLYPTDAKVRARVDQRLYFDATAFYSTFAETVVSEQYLFNEFFFNFLVNGDKAR